MTTNDDFRAILQDELAPILAQLDGLRQELATVRAHTDGISVLGKAIEVLQRDVRSLRDDMRVTTAIVQRVDGTLGNLWPELSAIHQWMVGVNNRVRKLEDAEND